MFKRLCVVLSIVLTGSIGVYISNLNGDCYQCLCNVVGCDLNHGCNEGYCGPFNISRVYWVDAGSPVLPFDDKIRDGAYEDCATDYNCSIKIIEGYLSRFGKDCNKDGVTNCFDYMMINFNGGYRCSIPLWLSPDGHKWIKRYRKCEFTS